MPNHHHHHGHHHSGYSGGGGFFSSSSDSKPLSGGAALGLVIILLITVPLLILFGHSAASTTHVGVSLAASTSAGGAGMGASAASTTVGGTAFGVSAATLGFGALGLYMAIGLAYFYSAAKEAYTSNKTLGNLMQSRIVPAEGWSVKGVIKSIGAVLWSPFLLLGGLSGLGIKAAITCFKKAGAVPQSNALTDGKTITSSVSMAARLGVNNNYSASTVSHATSQSDYPGRDNLYSKSNHDAGNNVSNFDVRSPAVRRA